MRSSTLERTNLSESLIMPDLSRPELEQLNLAVVISTSKYSEAYKSLKRRDAIVNKFSLDPVKQTSKAMLMAQFFSKKQARSVTHLEDPTVEQIRKFLRETLAEQLDNNPKVQTTLWVYVTGHSFKMADGVGILLNDKISLEKRPNPYPLESTLHDLATDYPNFRAEVLNDCCY